MSLRTSDRRHWCGSPPVGWKQLGFTAKMFEKIRGIATPACALVRNDRAFSNSPFVHTSDPYLPLRGNVINLGKFPHFP